MRPVEEGRLKAPFKGFNDRNTIFEFSGGGKWRQNEHRHQYQHAYMPDARVVEDGGRYLLYVDGIDEPVEVVRA